MSENLWPFVPTPRVIDVTHAEGRTLHLRGGGTMLDASGGAIISNIGHGRREVAEATAAAMVSMSYAVPPFATPERTRLIERLRRYWLPPHLTRVWLASGGSEAMDAAIKVALQHFRAKDEPKRTKIIGRDIAYHGTTALTLAVGGHVARKVGFESVLPDVLRVPTPYGLRSPLGRHHADFDIAAAQALEDIILAEGPETVAAFICEPITGSSGGAIMPGPRYWPMVQEICHRHGVLIISDEVMVGFGRTGKRFASEHFDLKADVMVSGKGLAGGYAPICGVFATDAVVAPLAEKNMAPMFYIYSGHPGACAAADKVLEIMEREALVERSAEKGEYLRQRLEAELGQHPNVAEIRGQGLFFGLEIVADRETLAMFPLEANVTARVVGAGIKDGVFFYSGGTGAVRDIICVGPAFTIEDSELDRIAETLKRAIDKAVG
jgi:adenosylmethionine-8-amino-7-oxononanoate aminotransferase